MSIAWLEDGRYRVDVRPRGRNGKRFCKIFDRKADAYVSQRGMMARHFFRCTSVHKIASKIYLLSCPPRQSWRGIATFESCTISCINRVRVWWGTRARYGGLNGRF